MQLFVSYASEDFDKAEQIAYGLAPRHQVFFDRNSLPPGGDFNSRIRAAIAAADGMIFLISPESVQQGSYTLTEMEFARDKWHHPLGKILPVMLRPTDFRVIPNFLKAVTFLETQGNLVAAVLAAVDKIWSPNAVIAGLSGFTHLFGFLTQGLQGARLARRREITQYLDELYGLLIDAHNVLEQGDIPHGRGSYHIAAKSAIFAT
jgi:TIR domain